MPPAGRARHPAAFAPRTREAYIRSGGGPNTSAFDAARFLGSSSAVVAIERAWLARVRSCRLYGYRMPDGEGGVHQRGVLSGTPCVGERSLRLAAATRVSARGAGSAAADVDQLLPEDLRGRHPR